MEEDDLKNQEMLNIANAMRDEIEKRSHGMTVIATRHLDNDIHVISLACYVHETRIDIIINLSEMNIESWANACGGRRASRLTQYPIADPQCFDNIEDLIKSMHPVVLASCGAEVELKVASILPDRLYDFLGFYRYRHKFSTVSKDRLMRIFSTMSKIKEVQYMEASAGTFFIAWEDGRDTVHRPDKDNWPVGISNQEWRKSWSNQ